MKRIVLFFVLLVSVVFGAQAQTLQKASVMQLVTANADAIGITKEQAGSLKVSNAYAYQGTQYVYLVQTYQGLPVYNQMLVLAFKDNKLVSHAGKLNSAYQKDGIGSATPSVPAANAVTSAFLSAGISAPVNSMPINSNEGASSVLNFGKLKGVSEDVTAELIWVPVEKTQSAKLVWQVQVVPIGKPDWWMMQIDAATGTLLNKINLNISEKFGNSGPGILARPNEAPTATQFGGEAQGTNPPSVTTGNYRVVPFPYESPTHHAFAVVTNPWLDAGIGNAAITNGWHFDGTTNYSITRGNNVYAYLDVDNNNTPNPAGNNFPAQSTTPDPSLTFNFVQDPTTDPNTTVNKNAAITSLFYWNNKMHDVTYQYGFTEPAANFQTDNMGRGGTGNDYVQAEGQDGGGSNNANFATPAEGGRPRMQMYLFDAVATVTLKVNTPASIAGNYASVESGFSSANKLAAVGPVTAQAVLFNDATGGTHDACSGPPSNSLTGKIALIYRNVCGFTVKVLEAQNAGAKAVIMINNVSGNPIVMGGTDNTIVIPAVMVSDVTGATLVSQIANNENITLSATSGQRLDGDLDAGVMTHEYGHGISNRLTGGGPSNCLGNAEQGGEGWSDYGALMMTTNWATATVNDGPNARPMGVYVEGQPVTGAGIRNYPYSTNMAVNPLTYANVGTGSIGTEVHNIGEVWCMAIWEMTWSIIQQEGINTNLYNYTGVGGNSIALKLVYEGMKLQPCNPGFLDARDAIIRADQNLFAGKHTCAIWTAFAKRGMGYSAKQGLSTSATDQTAAFDLPPAVIYSTQPANTSVCVGSTATFTAVVVPGSPTTYQWQQSTDGGTTWVNISGATTTAYTTAATTVADNGKKFRLIGTTACGSTTSNVATLTVIAASVGGTLAPSTSAVCGVTNTTGTLTLTGQSGNIIQWETSTDGGTTWVPFANTNNTYNYNVTVTTLFRVLVQGGGCATSAYSSVATVTITVAPLLSIIADPGATLCAGDPARLTVMEGAASSVTNNMVPTTFGAFVTFNFRNNNAYPVNITDISSMVNTIGGTDTVTVYYKGSAINGLPGAITAANGWNPLGGGKIAANGGTIQQFLAGLNLTVPPGATFGFAVQAFTTGGTTDILYRNEAGNTTVSVAGCDYLTGTNIGYASTTAIPAAPTNTVRKFIGTIGFKAASAQVTTGTFTWAPAAGLNTTTGNPVAASPATTTTYTVSNDNGSGCIRTASITINVNQRPAITVQPLPVTACAGTNANFAVTATGTNLTYQWQVSTDNCATYTNIAGATAATLTVANVTTAMNGNAYRVVVSGTCTPAVASASCVKLTVNALPAVTITPSGVVCGGVPGINGVALTTGGPAGPPPVPGSATFTSTTSVAVPDNSAAGATSTITASAIPANATVTKITVTLNMSHTYPGDMIINLKGPNSASVTNLYKYGTGAFTGAASGPATWGWYGAQVADGGVAFSTVATAPFIYGSNTTFKPDGLLTVTGQAIQDPAGYTTTSTTLSALYPQNPNGVWTLAMADGGGGDVGTLAGWSIKIDYTTPDPNGAPITSVWTPITGLYNDTKATVPYTGTQTPTVYAAPTAITTYTVTSTTAATGCSSSAQVVVNYTPPAPVVTPNPATICLGTSVKLKSTGINATPATWSPVTNLYSDAATTNAYVAGTAVDSVWAKPIVTTTYNATVNTASSGAGNTVAMTNPLAFVVTNITYNFRNNNVYPVTITNISSICNTAGATNVSAYYKTSAINGAPGAISVANGWTQVGTTNTITATAGTVIPFLTGLNLTVPAGATYGFVIQAVTTAGGVNLIISGTGTQTIASGGGCDIVTGANIGYTANTAVVPAAPTLTPYYFIGSVGFSPVIAPCTSAPRAVVVNVNTPAAITTQPTAATVCTDKVTSFTAVATGSAITHNWRVQTVTGGAWADVADGGVYSGSKTGTLVITAPPVSMNGYSYKDSVSTTPCAAAVSNAVKLTVNPLPTINLSVAPYRKLFPGLLTTITATVTPAAATYTWLRNGTTVANATSSSLLVDVNGLGDYTLRVTDVNGCNSTSGIISITDSASGKFFIYPNPNNGQFQVRYYSAAGNVNLPRGINVYDARGKRVLVQNYSISTPFARMDVDLRSFGSGVYWLELVDMSGNRLATGRAEVLR